MRATTVPGFLGKTAITGVGYSGLVRSSGRSVLSQAVEACKAAVEDAGLRPQDVDGLASFSWANDSVPSQAVATGLGIPEATFLLDINMGGQAPAYLVMQAALAVQAGLARHVVVFRAMNGRSGERVGSRQTQDLTSSLRYSAGLTAYPQLIAMWARRYLIETSASEADLAAVPIAQRRHAANNARAQRRDPLTLASYWESPMIAEPFRVADCTIEVDGACAVVVSSLDDARSLRHRPVVIQSAAYHMGRRGGLDAGDALLYEDMTRNYTSYLAERLWGYAGMAPSEVDCAQLYDCFSSSVIFALEGLGLAERGGAGEFLRSGTLPVNTNGGLLCEGYLHGMNTVAEAVLQLQGRSNGNSVENAETCVVTSGAMMDGSALILVGE
jgi:acetyl-CoA acetyltransferase